MRILNIRDTVSETMLLNSQFLRYQFICINHFCFCFFRKWFFTLLGLPYECAFKVIIYDYSFTFIEKQNLEYGGAYPFYLEFNNAFSL